MNRLDYWKRRATIAEQLLKYEQDYTESHRRWVVENIFRDRQLSDRCTYLYGLAGKHGATNEELRGPE